jgi:hypothetical protein
MVGGHKLVLLLIDVGIENLKCSGYLKVKTGSRLRGLRKLNQVRRKHEDSELLTGQGGSANKEKICETVTKCQ